MNRQHDEQAKLNATMQFWEMIKPVLATLDEDQLDRLLAKGFDDIDGYMKLLKDEMNIKQERMRQDSQQLMAELDRKKEEIQANEKKIKELKTEVESKKKEVERSEKDIQRALKKDRNLNNY